MAAITDSIRTGGTAEDLRVHRRGPDGRYALVRLDPAGAWTAPPARVTIAPAASLIPQLRKAGEWHA